MNFFFMDVVDAGVSRSVDRTLIIILLLTILAEALLMVLAKYNGFKKSILDSLIVNGASVVFGYALLQLVPAVFGVYSLINLLALLLITIAVESGILYLLNRNKLFIQTGKICVLMNVVTYVLFYLFTLYR